MDIKKYIGIPYRDRGRDYDGVDCWGLAYLISRDIFDKEIPFLGDSYSSINALDEVHEAYRVTKLNFHHIVFEDRVPGDIVMFRVCGLAAHAGVIIDNLRMVHALPGHNTCFERYDSATWSKRIEGIYRWVK